MKVRRDPRFRSGRDTWAGRPANRAAQITRGGPEYGEVGTSTARRRRQITLMRSADDRRRRVRVTRSLGRELRSSRQGRCGLSGHHLGASRRRNRSSPVFDKFRRDVPRMCASSGIGVRLVGRQARDCAARTRPKADWMISRGISVSITCSTVVDVGVMNGANHNSRTADHLRIRLRIALDEEGRRPKFFARVT